ncbi:hypothetical protein GQ53DRAFT_261908 [Thozetella sp. PMI_491]|nr:hypothetical protein GQ53DRAFT_261908 [Thozetella sp. PMI_491]
MFSTLPDLTPRDSHSLWYISSRNPNRIPPHLNPTAAQHGDGHHSGAGAGNHPNGPLQNARSRSQQAAVIERSALGRLRAEETYLDRRRANVVNLGHMWLKPPGLTKTLYQMREERREAEEHAEALRREQLAQDLAEAVETEPGPGAEGAEGEVNTMDALDMDVDPNDPLLGAGEEVEVDLDDDIPDADEGDFGYDQASSDDEEDEAEDEDEDEEEAVEEQEEGSGDEAYGGAAEEARQQRQAQRREVASLRATEDRMRETMVRNQAGGGDLYGEDELDEEGRAQILEEDDLVHHGHGLVEEGMDMDMDANLDDDIPEAESGGYEHTDSDASVSDDGHDSSSFALARSSGRSARGRVSLARTERSRNSLDINSLLSGDGSSVIGSSPHIRRRN